MGKFLKNQSTKNNGVGIIKSQKAIANTQNLCENFERKKIMKREENFTITMVITSGLLWCVRVPEFN